MGKLKTPRCAGVDATVSLQIEAKCVHGGCADETSILPWIMPQSGGNDSWGNSMINIESAPDGYVLHYGDDKGERMNLMFTCFPAFKAVALSVQLDGDSDCLYDVTVTVSPTPVDPGN